MGTILHYSFLCFAAFCFMSGFIPFAPQSFYRLAGMHPWIHRVAILGITLAALIWFFARKKPAWIASRFSRVPQFAEWLLFAGTAVLWSYAAVSRYQAFKAGFDMAIFTQAVWNTAHGYFLYSSIKGGICLLGDHFSPFLALFALPYRIWPVPECLLIFQAVLAASSIFPLYHVARRQLANDAWALGIVLAFTLYLPLRNAVRFDFHPEVAAVPLLIWAYYFLIASRLRLASLFLGLALLTKENMALVTFAFGFYALFKSQKGFGLFWMVLSPVYFVMATRFWIPAFSSQEYFYLSGNFMAWKEEGGAAFFKYLLNLDSFLYLVKIFLPVGFLSFFNFSFVLALPGLAQNLGSRNLATRSIFFQYTLLLTPFVFLSATESLRKIYPKKWGIFYLLLSSVLMAGVSDFYVAQGFRREITPHLEAVQKDFALIPAKASVRTHEFFAPHLANRKELHIFENRHPREGGSPKALQADYVVLDQSLLTPGVQDLLDSVRQTHDLILNHDGFMIFKRH